MALDLTSRYPGQVVTTDPGYPYGKARNVTVSGDGTGTPWEQDLVNDVLGFLQQLLVAGGVTPSGTPDKSGASQYLQALLTYISLHASFSGTAAFPGGLTCSGSASFSGGVTISSGQLQVTSANTSFTGTCTFGAVVAFDGGVNIATGPLSCSASATFSGSTTISGELILSGAGRIRETIAYAPDADHTFAATDATVFVWTSGATATHTSKITDAANEGARLRLVNYSSHDQTLQNSSGGSMLAVAGSKVPAVDGSGKPGSVDLVWLTNGTYTGWSQV